MSETLAADTITTAGDGPIVGETPTREFSPAELGLNTKEVEFVTPPEGETKSDETPETPAAEEDIVGTALKRGRPARDLDGLDEREQRLFKNMAREAYDELYPFYKKFKGKDKDLEELPTLREKLAAAEKATPKPASYYDHEDAYLLQQEYRDALVQGRTLRDVQEHWQEQLVNIKEGKPFYDLSADANGQLQRSAPIDPSPRAEAQILGLLAQVTQAQQTHQAKLESIKAETRNQFTTYKSSIENVHNQLFGKYKDQLGPAAAKVLEKFPEHTRSRPELIFAAHAYALLQHIVNTDKQSQAATNVANANKTNQKSAGPTMRTLTTAPRPTATPTTQEDYRQFRREFGV